LSKFNSIPKVSSLHYVAFLLFVLDYYDKYNHPYQNADKTIDEFKRYSETHREVIKQAPKPSVEWE